MGAIIAIMIELLIPFIVFVCEIALMILLASIQSWRYLLSPRFRTETGHRLAAAGPTRKWLLLMWGIFTLCASVVIVASGLALFAPAMAADTKLPMPTVSGTGPLSDLAVLEQEAADYNRQIGRYPPTFASESEKNEVYARWAQTLQKAWRHEVEKANDEKVMALLAELYRQGHNMDVIGAGDRANAVIERCLSLRPDSIPCHFSASYFYLAVSRQTAPRGEASLVRLRALLAPKVDLNVERGFIFAYLYQGQDEKALKQLDYYIRLDPDASWTKAFREGLIARRGKVIEK